MKHEKAIKVLGEELNKLGGAVFARYLATKSDEVLKTVESAEFLQRLFEGKLSQDEKEYLKPYLDPMWDISTAIYILTRDQ